MSLFLTKEDLFQSLAVLSVANKAQSVLALKAWERMISSFPSDGTLSLAQSSHFIVQHPQRAGSVQQGGASASGGADDANSRFIVTNAMLKRFASECTAFTSVTISDASVAESSGAASPCKAGGSGSSSSKKDHAPKTQSFPPSSFTFLLPSHEQLFYIRLLITCCLPREDAIGPSTPQSVTKLANCIVEALMALLQLLLPTAVLDDVKALYREGVIKLVCNGNAAESTTTAAAAAVLSEAASSPSSSAPHAPATSAASAGPSPSPIPSSADNRSSGRNASSRLALQAFDILQLPHTLWRGPRPLPLGDFAEKSAGGTFFGIGIGKLFRGGNSKDKSTNAASAAGGDGEPSVPLLDLRNVIIQQRYLLSSEEVSSSGMVQSPMNHPTPTASQPISATIGDFFVMSLCLKMVPLVAGAMTPPSNTSPTITLDGTAMFGWGGSGAGSGGGGGGSSLPTAAVGIGSNGGSGGSNTSGGPGMAPTSSANGSSSASSNVTVTTSSDAVASAAVGYSPQQVQPIALLAQTIVALCVGVSPSFAIMGAYASSSSSPSSSPSPTQGDIMAFTQQALTSMASVSTLTGQRAYIPHGFSLPLVPAAYSNSLLAASGLMPTSSSSSRLKLSGCRAGALRTSEGGQSGELKVSDVVALTALTAVSLLQSMCIVPVQVTVTFPLVNMGGGGGGNNASAGGGGGGALSSASSNAMAIQQSQYVDTASSPLGTATGGNSAVIASSPPPALSTALGALQSAIASPSQYVRSVMRAVRVGDEEEALKPLAKGASSQPAIVFAPWTSPPGAAFTELLFGFNAAAVSPTTTNVSVNTMRSRLLFLAASCSHQFTTSAYKSTMQRGSLVAFARSGILSANRSSGSSPSSTSPPPTPAMRTAQRLLDGFRAVFVYATRILATHGAMRRLLPTVVLSPTLTSPLEGNMRGSIVTDGSLVPSEDDSASAMTRAFELNKGSLKEKTSIFSAFATGNSSQQQQQQNNNSSADGKSSSGGPDANAASSNSSICVNDAASNGAAAEFEEDVVAVEFQSLMLNALLSLFVNCGPAVRSEALTITLVKRLVFPMLLETSLRQETAIHRVSFSLYLALRRDFRGPHIVNENGLFFNHVVFFLLESKLAKTSHKRLVLHLLMQVAEEPRDLVEVFLNYDCDKNSNNVFETLIRVLSKFTCGTDRPALPSLDSPTSLSFGYGGVPPPALEQQQQQQAKDQLLLTHIFTPIGLPSRSQYDSLYEDALQIVMLLPSAVRQWIDRFEDSLKSRELDDAKERAKRLGHHGGESGLKAAEETLQGIDDHSGGGALTSVSTATPAIASDFLEQRRMKRILASFFELFNVREKPAEAIAMLTSGKIPLSVIEGEIAEGIAQNREELAKYLVLERLSAVEEAEEETASPSSSGVEGSPSPAKKASPSSSGSVSGINYHRLVARFLHAHYDSIDKVVLGEYFSKMGRKEDIKAVFQEWVALHGFVKLQPSASSSHQQQQQHLRADKGSSGGNTNSAALIDPRSLTVDDIALPIDEALRVFLGGFKLLGEAQVVDRTMELFAAYYCESVKKAVDGIVHRWAASEHEKALEKQRLEQQQEQQQQQSNTSNIAPLGALGTSASVNTPPLLSSEKQDGEDDGSTPLPLAAAEGEGGGGIEGLLMSPLGLPPTHADTSAAAGESAMTGDGEAPMSADGHTATATTTTAASHHPLLADHEHALNASLVVRPHGEDAGDAAAGDGGEPSQPEEVSAGKDEGQAHAEASKDADEPQDPLSSHLYVMNQNTAFILAFSICMLNTDAHSAHVKDKMGQAQFVRNNSGIDDGKDVPAEILAAVYTRVSQKEIVLRPTNKLPPTSPQMMAQMASARGSSTVPSSKGFGLDVFTNAIVAPLGLVYGAVKLPFDAAGELVFNTSTIEKQRQRERDARKEMQEALTSALGELKRSNSYGGGGDASTMVEAGLEHAIPMWESCVDLVVTSLALALCNECTPTDSDTEHTDSQHAQWLLSVVADVFAVCVTFGFHEHVTILSSLLKQLSLVVDVIDPTRPLNAAAASPSSGAAAERDSGISSRYSVKQGQRGTQQKGCFVSRPIAMRNLRCAYTLLDCVSAHKSKVTSVAVWRSCYSILSRFELIHDKMYWAAAEEEVATNAQAQLLNSTKDSSWLGRFRTDIAKAATAVGGMVVPPGLGLGLLGDGKNTMLDISVKTTAGITDPLVRSLTVRNAIQRAMARVRAEDTSGISSAADSGSTTSDGVLGHPSFYTFNPPRDAASSRSTSADVRRESIVSHDGSDDGDDGTGGDAYIDASLKVGFARQAAMIIAIAKEAESEITGEGRTHLVRHLSTLLGESLVISPKLQWNELWKRVSTGVFLTGGTHPSSRVATDVLVASLYPLALRFFLHNVSDGGTASSHPPSTTNRRGGGRPSAQSSMFQQDVLRPFYTILVSNRDPTVQAVLLDCVNSLVAKAHDRIAPTTGWPLIFSIINTSASIGHMIPHGWRLFRSILQQYPLDALCAVKDGDRVLTVEDRASASNRADGLPTPSSASKTACAPKGNADAAEPSTSNSKHEGVTNLFDLRVFETGIIYTLTSFACQSDETIACDALLWLETCADAAQHGLAVFTATTQSPDGPPSSSAPLHGSGGTSSSAPYAAHARTFSAGIPSASSAANNVDAHGSSSSASKAQGANTIALNALLYVPIAPLSLESPLRLRPPTTHANAAAHGAGSAAGAHAASLANTVTGAAHSKPAPSATAASRSSPLKPSVGSAFGDKLLVSTSSDPARNSASVLPSDPLSPLQNIIAVLSQIASRHPRIHFVWQCLIECIAPIITIHSSIRVRCVAISALFSVLGKYGHLFDGHMTWDSVIWDACRSALIGHILSQGTIRRVLRLAAMTEHHGQLTSVDGSPNGANAMGSASAGVAEDSTTGRDLSWSEALCYLFVREAVSATLECEGKVIAEGAAISFACASAAPPSPIVSYLTHQRMRIGRWRNRLLSIVSERALSEQRLLRSMADPFLTRSGGGADDDDVDTGAHDDVSTTSRLGCSAIADIVLNIVTSIYLPSYLDVPANAVATTIGTQIAAVVRRKPLLDGEEGEALLTSLLPQEEDDGDGAASPQEVLAFILDNFNSISDAVREGIAAVPTTRSSNSNAFGSGSQDASFAGSNASLAGNNSTGQKNNTNATNSKFLGMARRPLFVEKFLRNYLSNVLPDAFERMQDLKPLVTAVSASATTAAISSDPSVSNNASPLFIGPVASHSRSSFLSLAGDGKLSAMLSLIPGGVSGGASVKAVGRQPQQQQPLPAPNSAAPQLPASQNLAGGASAAMFSVPIHATPSLIGITRFTFYTRRDTSFEGLLAHANMGAGRSRKQLGGLFGNQPATNLNAATCPITRRALGASVKASFYSPPPNVVALSTVADAALMRDQQSAKSSSPNDAATLATWKDFTTRVLCNALWKPFWNTTGSLFSALNPMPPLSNGQPAAAPRCLHCRCDCHNRPSHNISCIPFANTHANTSNATAGANTSKRNFHTAKCCCPCALSHTDSSYVLTGLYILQLMETCCYCPTALAAGGDGSCAPNPIPFPLFCRHVVPAGDILKATRVITRAVLAATWDGFGKAPQQPLGLQLMHSNDNGQSAGVHKASLYASMSALAKAPLLEALASTRAVLRPTQPSSSPATAAANSSSAAATKTTGVAPTNKVKEQKSGTAVMPPIVLPTDALPATPQGASILIGTLWSLAVQHKLALPLSLVDSTTASPYCSSLLSAIGEDLGLVTGYITQLSKYIVTHVIVSAEPPASAATVTATAKAAEEALIRRAALALADSLFTSQASAPATLFGLWSIAAPTLAPFSNSTAGWVDVASSGNASDPTSSASQQPIAAPTSMIEKRATMRNFLVLIRSVLLIALRQVLEACPSAIYHPHQLTPLTAVLPSQHEDSALLAPSAIKRLRAQVANRVSVALRRRARDTEDTEANTTSTAALTLRRLGTRACRDVCSSVAFYLYAHTPTGLAADSDDSEGDNTDPSTPCTITNGVVDPFVSLAMGDAALSSLFGTQNPPLNEPRNTMAITPPPNRVQAWLRERCNIRGDGSGVGASTPVTSQPPLFLTRVVTAGGVWEDMLLHIAALPMVAPPSSATEAVVPRLVHPLVTLLQHYLNTARADAAGEAGREEKERAAPLRDANQMNPMMEWPAASSRLVSSLDAGGGVEGSVPDATFPSDSFAALIHAPPLLVNASDSDVVASASEMST